MVIVDEKKLEAMPECEAQALDDESLEYDDALRPAGAERSSASLSPGPIFSAFGCPQIARSRCAPARPLTFNTGAVLNRNRHNPYSNVTNRIHFTCRREPVTVHTDFVPRQRSRKPAS